MPVSVIEANMQYTIRKRAIARCGDRAVVTVTISSAISRAASRRTPNQPTSR